MALLLPFLACNKNKVFDAKTEFAEYKWVKIKKVEFQPEITDNAKAYTITIAFRHIYGFNFQELPLNVEISSPSGKTENKKYYLQIADENNKYLSECSGDYCDLKSIVENNFKFTENGKYKFSISHELPVDIASNIIDIGMIIQKN